MDTHEAEDYVTHVLPTLPDVPPNLPVGVLPEFATQVQDVSEVDELEKQAHKERVLLSSDALSYLVAHTASHEERAAQLTELVKKARVSFPSEDGWVVLNLMRLETLMEESKSEVRQIAS